MTETALLYIARGHGDGLASARAFADAYLRHAAGEPHDLWFLAKGWPDLADERALKAVAEQCGAGILDLPDDGFDWAAYFRAADGLPHRLLCLMNSHARPLHRGWLGMLAEPARSLDAVVSATGSWESRRPLSSPGDRWDVKWRKRALSTARSLRYPAFPNAHLRSNAMVLRRDTLLDFARRSSLPRNKGEAFALESGKRGLSRFAEQAGARLLVAGADGQSYAPADWAGAATFRVPGQANLLVADNRTRDYADAAIHWRRALEYVTWGRHFTFEPGDA